jgi:RHS repeat-associated protein
VYTTNSDGVVTGTSPPGGGSGGSSIFDANGLPLLVTDPVGVQTSYTYNAQGSPLTVTRDYGGPTAVRFDYTYDANFPEKVTAVLPKNPANGQPDVAWQGWQYEYWPPGSSAPGALRHAYRVRRTGVLEAMSTYEYNSKGQITKFIGATGAVTDFEYNLTGDLVRVTTPSNNDSGSRPLTQYLHDSVGRVTSMTDPLGKATSYTYDALDRPLTLTLPKPSPASPLTFVTTYDYDNWDAPTGLTFTDVTDPNGGLVRQGNDQFGNLTRSIDGVANVTIYSHVGGRLVSMQDPNGNVNQYNYDANGRLFRIVQPNGATEEFYYFPDGQLQHYVRPQHSLHYEYDRHKRLTEITNDQISGGHSFVYAGQLLSQVDDEVNGTHQYHDFVYDDSYRILTESQGGRGVLTFQYLPDDRVQGWSLASGPTTTYSYYPDGSINTIVWSPVTGQFKYEHTARGQYQRITLPNGQTRNFGYDDQGRLLTLSNLSASAGNLATFSYAYDLNHANGLWNRLGQRVSMTATVPSQGLNNHLTKYEYDAAYQLSKVTYPNIAPFSGEVHSWTYDGIGNRLTSTVNGVTQSYGYQKIGTNPNNWQRLLTDGVNSYGYTLNGETLSRSGPGGTFDFAYWWHGRVQATSGAATASYEYDPQGRRHKKIVSGTTSTYVYRDLDLIREWTGAATLDYLFGPSVDEPLALSSSGQIYYYAVDGQGSVNLITNASAVVQNSYVYDVWGVQRSQTGSVANPFTYTAREVGEAGTWHYRARSYQPGIGRFLAADPGDRDWIAPAAEERLARRVLPLDPLEVVATRPSRLHTPQFAGNTSATISLNDGYRYVYNNPTAFSDPTGAKGIPHWVHWAHWAHTAHQAYECGKANLYCNKAVDDYCCQKGGYYERQGKEQICKFRGYECCRSNHYRCWLFMSPRPCVPVL